jgi:hypothetical protein
MAFTADTVKYPVRTYPKIWGDTMGRAVGSAKKQEEFFSLDEVELIEECEDRTLVLRRDPLPRKMGLIAAGAKEIRCISCNCVRPLAGAQEYGEGWLCEDCQTSVML